MVNRSMDKTNAGSVTCARVFVRLFPVFPVLRGGAHMFSADTPSPLPTFPNFSPTLASPSYHSQPIRYDTILFYPFVSVLGLTPPDFASELAVFHFTFPLLFESKGMVPPFIYLKGYQVTVHLKSQPQSTEVEF